MPARSSLRLLAPLFTFVTLGIASCGDATTAPDGAEPADLVGMPSADQARPAGDDLASSSGDLAMTGDLAVVATPDLAGMGGDGGGMNGGDDLAVIPDLFVGPDIANPPCNAQTCPAGCCFGLGVCTPPSLMNCGTRGDVCQACDPMLADNCMSGACACGAGPACQVGQVCENGACVCNAQSCPVGCCDGNTCQMPSLAACGTGGQVCVACGRQADACTAGVCTCGNNTMCAPGQACSRGGCICNINSCPDGCCAGTVCTKPSITECGVPGAQCAPCDPMLADTCATGNCACGNGPPCLAGQQCVNGQCVCNAKSCPAGCCMGAVCTKSSAATCGVMGAQCSACNQGDACVNGVCSGCALTCKGCCAGQTCVDPPTPAACGGLNGASCMPCDLRVADTCAPGGKCLCGAGPACGAGLQCVNGQCKCTAQSCANGCCSNNVCLSPTLNSCGVLGGGCATCDPTLADVCAAGACACGTGAACVAGQRCVNGACVCDAMSCGNGCCAGNVCNAPSLSTCGQGGAACAACSTKGADQCRGGSCVCGNGPACAAGQECVNGQCMCTPSSCPMGCCQGDVCQPGNLDNACGSAGGACGACAPGTSCFNGACAGCSQTCNGCCAGNVCNQPSLAACGPMGGACVACDRNLADGCDPLRKGCVCGAGPACTAGQLCVNGQCVCNAQSCANGCCSGSTCLVGVNCVTCKSYHQTCTRNTDCCSGNCQGGTCGVPLGQCLLANNTCTRDLDCCSGHCDVDVDGKKRCTLPNQCRGLGAACAQASDCCSLYCDPMSKQCSSAKVCVAVGGACAAAIDCCSSSCVNGTCANPGACNNLGEVCNGNNCCSLTCLGGRCFWDFYCRSMGDVCNVNADCCIGVCDPNKKRCAAVSQCVPTNEPCTGLRSCCNTLCVDNGLGLGVGFCYPIGGCRVQNDVCTSDKQCCSGKCDAPDLQGVRRCGSPGNCLADGEVCGGQGASQNCCSGGKANCVKTVNGVSRCLGNNGMACYGNGQSCHFGQECCSGICLPDPNSMTGFSCGAKCLPIGAGTCTTDADCCQGGICQGGVCVSGGQSCVALGAACTVTAECCTGTCINGFCSFVF